MTDREKLIALMRVPIYPREGADPAEVVADYLLDNGVMVREWIPVTERLPQEGGFYRVYHKNSKAICDRFYYEDCPDLFVNVKDDPITHWKPIEQPPKEGE